MKTHMHNTPKQRPIVRNTLRNASERRVGTSASDFLSTGKAFEGTGTGINCASFLEACTAAAFEDLEEASPGICSAPGYVEARHTILAAARASAQLAMERRKP